MPLYEYEHIDAPPERCERRFDAFQKMSADPHVNCPDCGEPVRRVISSFAANPRTERKMMSNSNLQRLGFTKYEKSGDGQYKKTVGAGPDVINRD